jgi:integrase
MSSGSGSWTRTWPSYSPTQSRGGGRFPRSRRWRTSRPWRPSSVPPTPRFRCSPRSPDSGRKSGCAREARHRQAGRSAARPPSVHRWAGEALRQAEPVAPGRPAARQGRARARRATTEGRHPLVFPAERGGHLNLHNWRRDHWKPAVRAAGLEHRTPYALRHTFASFAIAAGSPCSSSPASWEPRWSRSTALMGTCSRTRSTGRGLRSIRTSLRDHRRLRRKRFPRPIAELLAKLLRSL